MQSMPQINAIFGFDLQFIRTQYYDCCEDAGHEINDDERRVFEKINTPCCRNLLAVLIVR